MTLSYEELMSRDLKGFKFSVIRYGMTMTSRHASITDYYIVLEDNGDKCVVSEIDSRSFKSTWSKEYTASKIASSPLCDWDEETKSYVNAIEKI